MTALLSQVPLENPLHKTHSKLREGNTLLLNERKKKMTHYVHQLDIVHLKAIETNLSKSQVIFNHEFILVPLFTQTDDVICIFKMRNQLWGSSESGIRTVWPKGLNTSSQIEVRNSKNENISIRGKP